MKNICKSGFYYLPQMVVKIILVLLYLRYNISNIILSPLYSIFFNDPIKIEFQTQDKIPNYIHINLFP